MKNYPQIISKVFESPWLITTAKHRAIQRLLQSRIEGGDIEIDVDEPEEPEMAKEENVAIIPVHGVIGKHLSMLETMCGGCDIDSVMAMTEAAELDNGVNKIIYDFRSPGGTVTGIPEAGRRIAGIASKKTVAFTDSECCSGALWLATQCHEFYSTESASVGSVGVYMALLDYSRMLENEGINVQEISAGEFKTMGAYWKPLRKEEKAMLQADVDKIYSQFKEAVNRNRSVDDKYMQGQIFDGQQASEIGMTDGMVESITDLIDA